MIFKRTYHCNTDLSGNDVKKRLTGKHINIHELDFEIMEKEDMLKIIPRAENIQGLKTLPITHVRMQNGPNKTKMKITSKPRKTDVGGPYIVVIFCLFLVLGATAFYIINPKDSLWPSATMLGIGLLIFIIFWLRMETGYFDYVRKIRDFIKSETKLPTL